MLPIIRSILRRDWVRDFLLLAFFIAIVYGLWLGSYPFFTPDEGRYAEVAREMVASGDYITPRVNGIAFLDKPALYYWLQAAAIHFFGVKEWAIRLFPALLGLFGCLATYFAGRQLFSRRTGILSAIMLASAPLYFIGAHYANLNLKSLSSYPARCYSYYRHAGSQHATPRPFTLRRLHLRRAGLSHKRTDRHCFSRNDYRRLDYFVMALGHAQKNSSVLRLAIIFHDCDTLVCSGTTSQS